MSHTHRDENDKTTGPDPSADVEVDLAPPPKVVTNAEAEREAKERRDADGVSLDSDMQRRFLGDADGEAGAAWTILTIEELEARALVHAGARAHRGPPSPRASEVGDDISWLADLQLVGLAYLEGGTSSASWAAALPEEQATRLSSDTGEPWSQ